MITGGVLCGWPRGMLIGFACRGSVRRGVVIGGRCGGMVRILTMGARRLPGVVVSGIVGRISPWVVGMGGQSSRAVPAAVSIVVGRILVRRRDPLLVGIGRCSAVVTPAGMTIHAKEYNTKRRLRKPKMEEGKRETPSCRHEAGLGLGTAHRGLLLTFSTPVGKHIGASSSQRP